MEARSHDNDDREGDFKDEDWHAGDDDDDDDDDDRHHHGSRGHHHRGDGEHEHGWRRSKRVKRIAAIACGSVGLLAFIVFVAVLVVKRNKLRLYFAKRNNSVYVSMKVTKCTFPRWFNYSFWYVGRAV